MCYFYINYCYSSHQHNLRQIGRKKILEGCNLLGYFIRTYPLWWRVSAVFTLQLFTVQSALAWAVIGASSSVSRPWLLDQCSCAVKPQLWKDPVWCLCIWELFCPQGRSELGVALSVEFPKHEVCGKFHRSFHRREQNLLLCI